MNTNTNTNTNQTYDLTDKTMALGRLLAVAGACQSQDDARLRGRILALLKLREPLHEEDLCLLLDLDLQELEPHLAALEQEALIARTPEAGRSVSLTDLGRQTPALSRQDRDEALFGCLDGAERQRLGEYLDRVSAHLEQQGAQNWRDAWHGEFPEGMEQLHRWAMRMPFWKHHRGRGPFHTHGQRS